MHQIPIKFIDGREILPRHATRRFATRNVSGIEGIVTHHTAGSGSPADVAAYHVGKNHVCKSGCPGPLYTFMIYLAKSGDAATAEVWWANDLDAMTFSQGGHGSPLPGTKANVNFLGVCMVGNFYSRTNKGGTRPHVAQVAAWFALIGHLLGSARADGFPAELFGALHHVSWSDMYGHFDFGKEACPGDDMKFIVELAQDSRDFGVDLPESAREWQQALVNAGYKLGRWGPEKNGVDGDWGQTSKVRLVEFQRANGLEVTGTRDPATAKKLAPYHTA